MALGRRSRFRGCLAHSMCRVRLPRALRCEVGLDWLGPNGRLVLDAREIPGLVSMYLQRGEELRVVILHREAEMRALVVLDHFGIIATVNSGRPRHAAGAVVV